MQCRRLVVVVPVALVALVSGCTTASPTPSNTVSGTNPSSVASRSAAASASSGSPEAGRPYTADDILAAMRDSLRPGGVPDELETHEVAQAIAEAIWTFDGQPWSATSIGGSCGAAACTVEVVGTRDGSSGEDLWSFDVAGSDGAVRVAQRELGAVPDVARENLDALARSLLAGQLDDLVLGSVTWVPPPDAAAFELAYRSGNEEASCAVDVVIDPVAGRIVDSRSADC